MFANVIAYLFFDSAGELIFNSNLQDKNSINYLKLVQLFTSIGFFIFPILFYSYLTNLNLYFKRYLNRQSIILVASIMLLIVPFISLLLQWNSSIVFPKWLTQFDINSTHIIEAFLQMDSIYDLIINLFLLAVIPAIGEELFFRGYVQQTLINKYINKHSAILVTAFIFSLFHLDFAGLIPRFFLGALLGYLFLWSKNIWIPIIAHFINNGQAVLIAYISSGSKDKIDKFGYSISNELDIDLSIAFFSFTSVILLLFMFYKLQKVIKQ
tara:strand:- start:6618 stop:7421 length:804 start_codon:yes stop_codon:yes gene_type:complete